MLKIIETDDYVKLYEYQMRFQSPYFLAKNYDAWKQSFIEDVDGEGRRLFLELWVKVAYDNDAIVGFIQYGKSAIGFDKKGDISSEVSYPIIRNLYFDQNRMDAGKLLLQEALNTFDSENKVYAFFHYFGMSCFARHGKLFERYEHIEELLKQNGFEIEHENVYYSCMLNGYEISEAEVVSHELTEGNQQYIDLMLAGDQVGGCEVHFVDDKTAYLRWIYINENITGQGVGTKCMKALKNWLYCKGVTRFDTDTALSNLVAQGYYEKNNFTREGITRSYYEKDQGFSK